jgi:outer membrane immunogenic protein
MGKAAIGFAAVAAMIGTPVLAADMAVKAPPMLPPPVFSWTGFYAGAEIGGGWATQQTTIVTQPSATPAFPPGDVLNPINLSGALGGLYGGYNYQVNQVVFGIDGDYTWANLSGTGSDISPVPGNGDVANHWDRMNWVATVAGRLGYAYNNWLFFAKGGWAWAGFDGFTTTSSPAGVLLNSSTTSSTRNGWTVGTGAEWGFAAHWSAKLEYDYVGFNTSATAITETSAATGAVTFPTRSTTSHLNMVKAGVAYRF